MIDKHTLTQKKSGRFSRRDFIKNSTALGAFTLLTPASKVLGANQRLRLAACGVNNRGDSLMNQFAEKDNVEIAWIVDPDSLVLVQRGHEMREKTGRMPKLTTDVRHVLDDPEVDGLVVATPNHWHSQMVIWAAQAGKHIYVEKPASHDIYEGRVALEAAKKYGIVVQHGTQRRSDPAYANLIKAIHSGRFGKLAVTHAFASKPRSGIGLAQPSDPPRWLDWNMWRGHALLENFHNNLVHYNWHWFWNTGNGDLNNQGTHQLDVAFWSLDPDMYGIHPGRIMSLGGRFVWDDQGETPNSQFSVAEYPNGQIVLMNVRNVDYEDYERRVENRFYFEDGGKIIIGGRRVVDRYIAPDGDETPLSEMELEPAEITPGGHTGSFVKACRAGDPNMVNAGMFEGHYSSVLGHLMNYSYRLGEEKPLSARVFEHDNPMVMEQFNWFHSVMHDGMGLRPPANKYCVGPWLNFDNKTEKFTGSFSSNANSLLKSPRRTEFDIPAPDKV